MWVFRTLLSCLTMNKQPYFYRIKLFSFRCSFEMSIWRRTKCAMNNVPKKGNFELMKKSDGFTLSMKASWQNQPDGKERKKKSLWKMILRYCCEKNQSDTTWQGNTRQCTELWMWHWTIILILNDQHTSYDTHTYTQANT